MVVRNPLLHAGRIHRQSWRPPQLRPVAVHAGLPVRFEGEAQMRNSMRKNPAGRAYVVGLAGLLFFVTGATARAADSLDEILSRTSARVADSIERFSETKCTEKVDQQ